MLGLGNFVEPNSVVFNISMPNVDQAVQNLKSLLRKSQKEDAIVHRALEKRISRIDAGNAAADLVVSNVLLAVTWPFMLSH